MACAWRERVSGAAWAFDTRVEHGGGQTPGTVATAAIPPCRNRVPAYRAPALPFFEEQGLACKHLLLEVCVTLPV